ncbi:hypothetical protein I204_04858 [Kwoniella mangroviensis CBS 8886]|nr:hypothetical protein I204_04858 [Kwoniella mangroviensis CBS 8886]
MSTSLVRQSLFRAVVKPSMLRASAPGLMLAQRRLVDFLVRRVKDSGMLEMWRSGIGTKDAVLGSIYF